MRGAFGRVGRMRRGLEGRKRKVPGGRVGIKGKEMGWASKYKMPSGKEKQIDGQ